jgi:hypothetical protein
MRLVWTSCLACALSAGVVLAARQAQGVSPAVAVIDIPDFWGQHAIWGATGTDREGRIWLGVSSNDFGTGSAHLYRYDPATGQIVDTGDVVGALEKAGVRRPDEKQMKIHSRIVQMPDGYLYFASMDESGEKGDGSRLPRWGGHLWRIGARGRWQHLAAVPHALIAVAAGGPYVYALGYFDHVVYQFDTRTGRMSAKTKSVGSAGGHVSRNFFADDRGHVFVPRVVQNGPTPQASLVELDSSLDEVISTPLPEYFERGRDQSHGIVALHPDGEGGWHFATGKGRLYRVRGAAAGGPATVIDQGWYHPAGPRYVASMFRTHDGWLHGAAEIPKSGGRRFEWVSRDPAGDSTVAPFPYGQRTGFTHAALVYGSITRDASGRMYVVGTMNYKPIVLQVTAPTGR